MPGKPEVDGDVGFLGLCEETGFPGAVEVSGKVEVGLVGGGLV